MTLTGNVVEDWLAPSVEAHNDPAQTVDIFMHTDQLPDLPTSNTVVLGNTIARDRQTPAKRPYCLQVWGSHDGCPQISHRPTQTLLSTSRVHSRSLALSSSLDGR